MKAFLMYPDRDFDPRRELPWNHEALVEDLGLRTLFDAMAGGDEFLLDVARRVVLSSLTDPDTIRYRQEVLRDCLRRPAVVHDLYQLAIDALRAERKIWLGTFSSSADLRLQCGRQVLGMFVGMLRRLRRLADEHATKFRSDGFTRLFGMIATELDDDYLDTVEDHLQRLRFEDGAVISAELGAGNRGTNYVLRRPHPRRSWIERMSAPAPTGYVYRIREDDDTGAQALGELKDRGVGPVADALVQSNDHIIAFFTMLRTELAFYVGCLHLHDRLTDRKAPTCRPDPLPPRREALTFRGLYDVNLALHTDEPAVGNDLTADGTSLLMVTGANRGGKSTFLRSLGQAQLMMQCGLFVAANSFRANICTAVATHFTRAEDTTMTSGKLDEELSRMSEIADHLRPSAVVLFNESFAATNEREGSQIAREIIRALLDTRVKVVFVTHLYDLAHGFYRRRPDVSPGRVRFLRAERRPDGRRTFRLVTGEPLPTSYGEDLYRRIFGGPADPEPAGRQRSG